MKLSKNVVVYSIALAVAAIAVTPVATLSAYAAKRAGASNVQHGVSKKADWPTGDWKGPKPKEKQTKKK